MANSEKIHDIPRSLNEEDKTEIITKISKIVKENYVYPEIGEKIGNHLLTGVKNQSYKEKNSMDDFAKSVLERIEEIVVDKHNRVLPRGPNTERYFKMADRMAATMAEHDMDGVYGKKVVQKAGSQPESKIIQRKVGRAVNSGGGPQRIQVRGMAPGDPNHFKSGIEKIDVLANNIGYLELSMFESTQSPDKQKMIDGLTKLNSTDALIVDLRNCAGGDGSMVLLVQSFIFGVKEGEKEIILTETYMRPSDITMKSIPQPWEHGKSYRDKPVYVLTSHRTGSAAEAFTFAIKNHQRGTIIGKTTGGGGHPTSFHLVDNDLLFMCSIGRSYDPKTNLGWEAVGITPNIESEIETALDKAKELISGI